MHKIFLGVLHVVRNTVQAYLAIITRNQPIVSLTFRDAIAHSSIFPAIISIINDNYNQFLLYYTFLPVWPDEFEVFGYRSS